MGYSLLLGTVAEKKIRKKFGLVLNPPRMPFIFCPFRLAKFGQIMTIKNFVLIIFFGKFFFWCKICFSQYRCIFQQKKWGSNFFTEKRPNWGGGGGGGGGFGKRPHFFRIFFSATFPNARGAMGRDLSSRRLVQKPSASMLCARESFAWRLIDRRPTAKELVARELLRKFSAGKVIARGLIARRFIPTVPHTPSP